VFIGIAYLLFKASEVVTSLEQWLFVCYVCYVIICADLKNNNLRADPPHGTLSCKNSKIHLTQTYIGYINTFRICNQKEESHCLPNVMCDSGVRSRSCGASVFELCIDNIHLESKQDTNINFFLLKSNQWRHFGHFPLFAPFYDVTKM